MFSFLLITCEAFPLNSLPLYYIPTFKYSCACLYVMFKLWWDRLMGASGSNNFAIQFGAHCSYCFAISSKRKSVCLSRKCPKGTLNFRPFSWIVSSVELWPLCTLYRQFSWEPFTMPVSWTKVKVWKQEGISSSALAGSLLHRCKVCECSLASDCGSKKGTGLFDWSFLLCWDVEFGNRLGASFLWGAEDSGCVVLFRWNEKVGGGWAASPCTAVEDFVNMTFMVWTCCWVGTWLLPFVWILLTLNAWLLQLFWACGWVEAWLLPSFWAPYTLKTWLHYPARVLISHSRPGCL